MLIILHVCSRNLLGDDFNEKYEDESFLRQNANFRLESAYSSVLQMEHSARQEVAKLRKMYEKMESVALTEIQDVSARLIGILLETKEKVQTKLSLDYESQMEIDHLVGNAVASVKKKEFKFAPSRDFLSCLKLGTLQQATRPNKHRRHPMNPRARSHSPCLAYRDRTHGHHRHRSSSSSSSSHSSGFIQIEWANGRSIETSNAYKAVHREGIEKQLFIDAIDGLVCCQSEVCTCAISLKRTESDLSSYSGTASSFASSTEQTSIDLNDTKTENSLIYNSSSKLDFGVSSADESSSDTFMYHRTIGVPEMQRDCHLSSICLLPTNELVLIDQKHPSVMLYDPNFTIFKKYRIKRSIPIRVCCCDNSNVFVLFRNGSCKYNIILYEVQYIWKKTDMRYLHDLVPKKKVQHTCEGQICSLSCSLNKVICICFNYHIHISTDEGKEERVVTLDLKEIESNMFWPQFCAVDRDTIAIFIYDVYSSSIRKYMISNGECIWTIAVENGEIDNMIVCGERLYISQNEKNRIQSFKQETGKIDQYFSLTENVRFPFGLACNHNQNTILVTAYNYNGSKGNKIIKYF